MMLTLAAIAALPFAGRAQKDPPFPITPIAHVIVVFGENRSFDHVFATYRPKKGQTIHNLLSEGIVNEDGSPGEHYDLSYQYSATDKDVYRINPGGKQLYAHVPPPFTKGAHSPTNDWPAPFATVTAAQDHEPALPTCPIEPCPEGEDYYRYLTTGATGLPEKKGQDPPESVLDTRIASYDSLPSGVFQLTSPNLSYDSYTGDPVHRFYQMWQQTDCGKDHPAPEPGSPDPSKAHAADADPSGCFSDLFPWVEVTIGAGSNGKKFPSPFTTGSTGEGGIAMEFYNVHAGDAPYLKSLADRYTLSDNMHQGVMGGTGANHIMFGYADAMWYSDGFGNPATPPLNQIEDPNPVPGTNNWYNRDGYKSGSYTNCSDENQPGVKPILKYLEWLKVPSRCEPGHYYLLNNYNPGYTGTGALYSGFTTFTIPPTSQRHIGDVLGKAGLSYTFYGGDWDLYLTDPVAQNPYDAYCNICNPFQYATDIMTDPNARAAHIKDTSAFFVEVRSEKTLPAVSIIQPSEFVDGHPASSKLDLWEGFVKNIITSVQANKKVWNSTAIFLIFDEGGGYYDSGYIQPVDFFGDGTRMPCLIVSPYSEGGKVYHAYADHVSIIKFIERNWNLPKITPETSKHSRDWFPNPATAPDNPYVPTNRPAIDDLFGAFDFSKNPGADE
jgi:phospholipase C